LFAPVVPAAGKPRQNISPPGDRFGAATDPEQLRELARQAVAGDRDALQGVFAALFPLIHKHLSFVLGFGPLVEDAVQDSMLAIHRALPGFRGEASVATWALAIASRTCARYARRERKHRVADVGRAIEDALFSADSTTSGIELELLVRALGRLKLKKRQAFVLMAILDYSASEAGEILNTSANTAASRCRHARQELLDHMERHDRP